MRTENLDMWDYWRDEKGLQAALEDYFPQTLAGDAVLQSALAQLRVAQIAIGMRMQELVDQQARAQSTPQPADVRADQPLAES